MRASPATTIMRRHRTGATYAAAMERRTDAVELLDGPLDDPAALAGNLRDLRRINRWLGGVRLSADAIDALAAHRDAADRARRRDRRRRHPDGPPRRAPDERGRRLSVVGIDSRPEVLAAAVVARPAVAATPGLELHVGDGRSLPYPDGSFDIAHASLVLHHLAPDEAVAPAAGDGSRRAARASSSTTSTGAGSAGSARG